MRKALIAGLMLAIMIPMIGIIMVNRKTPVIGDALSHAVLSGIRFGLILGFDPLSGSAIAYVVAVSLTRLVRKKFPQYGDMATVVIMSTGLGIAAILSGFAPDGNSLGSYLFGGMSSVTNMDMISVPVISVLILTVSTPQYAGLLTISVNKNVARLTDVEVNRINTMFTLLSAITVALAVKIVGTLMVASLVALPVATTLIIAKGYKETYIVTIVLGVLYMMLGMIQSRQSDIKPGKATVVDAVIGMIVSVAYLKTKQPNRRNFSNSENDAKIK